VFWVAEGKEVVVTRSAGAATTSESRTDWDCVGFDASATAAVNLKVPLAVGVPEMSPVALARLSPAGSVPEVIDQL
jgi:hypothetical protein